MESLKNKYFLAAVILVAGVMIGWLIKPSHDQPQKTSTHVHATEAEVWTCSMHPSVRQGEPGKCPICGMDLIPLDIEGEGADPMEVNMSATAIRLANIQTSIVGSQVATKDIRLNGKVMLDERRVSTQAAHIPGRIEKLYVNFTGESVLKGQKIAEVYSPGLVTAQRELLEANKIKNEQPQLFHAARQKLSNWKLHNDQIDLILKEGKPQERFPLHADVSGVVIQRRANLGDHLMEGMPIYDVVDLSHVWVLFDVYENDMSWVKKGSKVEFTVQSLPGEEFKGVVEFVNPTIDPMTRVATARVEVANPQLRLKPEMFTTGIVSSELGKSRELVVPKSAVMWTGERSVVYSKRTTDAGVSFVMHEVLLGPSLGDGYVIKQGLEPGMEIVTNGTFTIDAAAQLAGKRSMMNPAGDPTSTRHYHGDSIQDKSATPQIRTNTNKKFVDQLTALLPAYLKLKDALVATNSKEAMAAATELSSVLTKVDMKLLTDVAHKKWMPVYNTIAGTTAGIAGNDNIEDQRAAFSKITEAYFTAIQTFNLTGLHAYYQYCPMAFNNKGGYWISADKEIKNPYFGSKMLRCGKTKLELR